MPVRFVVLGDRGVVGQRSQRVQLSNVVRFRALGGHSMMDLP